MLFLGGCLFATGVAVAQQTVQQGTQQTTIRIAAIQPSERLGPDDLLEIYVADSPQLSRTFRIGTDGRLTLPLLPGPLTVTGLTPVEVAAKLRDALVQNNLLVEPVVNVSVLEYRSRPVSVVGAVMHPITFQATGRTTLMDAVAAAGGLSPTAGGHILVTAVTPASTEGGTETRTVRDISAKDLVAGVASANPKLNGGEEISIPEAQKIFVAGNVIHPGAFAMQSDAETTVIKAVALSAGLAPYTANYALIYRSNAAGTERKEIRVPLTDIMKHREPDVALAADDILYVPPNNGKRLTVRMIEDIAGFGQTVGGYAVIH